MNENELKFPLRFFDIDGQSVKDNYEFFNEKDVETITKRFDITENYLRWKEAILNGFNGIVFDEPNHKYFVDGVEYKAVSYVLHEFVKPVDWNTIKKNFAAKNGVEISQVDKWWKINNFIATNTGTKVHNFAESCFYFYTGQTDKVLDSNKDQLEGINGFRYFIPTRNKEIAVCKFWNDMLKVPGLVPMLSEAKVHTRDLPNLRNYCGTFDLLFYYNNPQKGIEGVFIFDYKTNSKPLIDDNARKFNKFLLEPFDGMYDDAFSHYTLQLSLYQIPIEKILGIPVLGRRLVYLKDDGTYEIMQLEDKTDALTEALKIEE